MNSRTIRGARLLFVTLAALAVLVTEQRLPAAPQDNSTESHDQLRNAQALLLHKQYKEALKEFKRAEKLSHKSSADAFWGAGLSHYHLGDWKEAVKDCEAVVKLDSNATLNAQAHNLAGVALVRIAGHNARKLSRAEAEFRAALGIVPDFAVARYNLGVMLLQGEQEEEGVQELKRYLAGNPVGRDARLARRYVVQPKLARAALAPEFHFVSARGEHVSLESLSGKLVLLDFWATWCEPCRDAIPDLRKLNAAIGDLRFRLVSISVDKDEAKWRDFIQKGEMDWVQGRDGHGEVALAFGVNAFPTYILLDGDGLIQLHVVGGGPGREAQLKDEIERVLKEMSVLPPGRMPPSRD